MTVSELLTWLDGNGLVITDWDMIIDELNSDGIAIFDEIDFSRNYPKSNYDKE